MYAGLQRHNSGTGISQEKLPHENACAFTVRNRRCLEMGLAPDTLAALMQRCRGITRSPCGRPQRDCSRLMLRNSRIGFAVDLGLRASSA